MKRSRWIGPAVLTVGVAVSVSPWFWWDYTGLDVGTVVLDLWQVLPFAVLLLFRRLGFSDIGTAVTAVVVAILTVLGQIEMSRDDSSTAVLGFIWFPIWYAILVVIAWFIDVGTRAFASRFANRSAGQS